MWRKLLAALLNISVYWTAWSLIVYFADQGRGLIALGLAIFCYLFQLLLFAKSDRDSLLVAIPLSIYALLLGLIQETLFIHFGILTYYRLSIFPPIWLLTLYPLFGLTLNSSLSFLNRYLPLSFFLGGAGALISYFSGQELHRLEIFIPRAYVVIPLAWGVTLTILLLLNRRLLALRDFYTDKEALAKPITGFFDGGCPVCSREMRVLKTSCPAGTVHFVSLASEETFLRGGYPFSYEEAMREIHVLDADGKVLKGTDALSALYARAGWSILAIFLQAPLLRSVCKVGYQIFARLRPYLKGR